MIMQSFYYHVFLFLFSMLVAPCMFHSPAHHLVASAASSINSNPLPFANYDDDDDDVKNNQDKTQGGGGDVHGDGNQELDSWTTLVFENENDNEVNTDDNYYKHLTFREIDFLNKAWMATLDTILSDKRMVALGVETIAELHEPTTSTDSNISLHSSQQDDKSNPTTKQEGDEEEEESKDDNENNKHYHLRHNQQHRAARYSRGRRTRYRQTTSYHCRLCNNNRRRYQRRDLFKQAESSSSDTDAGATTIATTTTTTTASMMGIFDQKSSTKRDIKASSSNVQVDSGKDDKENGDSVNAPTAGESHHRHEDRLQELLQDMVCEILRGGPHVKFHKVKKCIVRFQESA